MTLSAGEDSLALQNPHGWDVLKQQNEAETPVVASPQQPRAKVVPQHPDEAVVPFPGCRKEYETGSFQPVVANTGMRSDMLTAMHAGHSSTTAMKKYVDQDATKAAIPANLFRGSVDPDAAMLFLRHGDDNRPAFFDIEGAFRTNWPKQQAALVDKMDFVQQYTSGPGILNGICPVVGCTVQKHFPSDLFHHLKQAHGGRDAPSSIKSICPSCDGQYTVRSYLMHVNPRAFYHCKDQSREGNPLWNVSCPKLKANGKIPPGVWPNKCSFEGCLAAFTSRGTLLQHQHRCTFNPEVDLKKSSKQSRSKTKNTGKKRKANPSEKDSDSAKPTNNSLEMPDEEAETWAV